MVREIRDNILSVYLSDNVKARKMLPDGTYVRKKAAEASKQCNSQERLLKKQSGIPRKVDAKKG